jgi:ribosome maturation factor RimP
MMKNEKITGLIEPSIEDLGYSLWGVEYVPQGKHSVLRIYIDKETGIGVGDCQRVTRQVSTVLDVENPIQGQYTLEVSSPGLERPLFKKAQYEQSVGKKVQVKLGQPIENKRKYIGHIEKIDNDMLVLKVGDEMISMPLDNVTKANLVS